MSSNSVLKEHAEPGMAIARALSEASGTSERLYVDKQYETKRSWPHSRRVIIKAEVTRYPGRIPRDNARFVVTDLVGDPEYVYEKVYSRRGDVENLRQGTRERHPHGQDELHQLRGEPTTHNLARHGVRPTPGDQARRDRRDLRQRAGHHHQAPPRHNCHHGITKSGCPVRRTRILGGASSGKWAMKSGKRPTGQN